MKSHLISSGKELAFQFEDEFSADGVLKEELEDVLLGVQVPL